MRMSDSLAEFCDLHPRCHPLKGELKGLWSADLDHPYRLIFEPADDPLPHSEDGGLVLNRVYEVRIASVNDTH